jgi:acyl transferase domain-containing protein
MSKRTVPALHWEIRWSNLARHFGVKLQPGSCGIGSLKTHIGHLETAAGIAGIIKVLLALRHRQLPGLANFSQLNPNIELQGSPFYLVSQLKDWQVAEPALIAGVSAFGFGGTNAHVVLQSCP